MTAFNLYSQEWHSLSALGPSNADSSAQSPDKVEKQTIATEVVMRNEERKPRWRPWRRGAADESIDRFLCTFSGFPKGDACVSSFISQESSLHWLSTLAPIGPGYLTCTGDHLLSKSGCQHSIWRANITTFAWHMSRQWSVDTQNLETEQLKRHQQLLICHHAFPIESDVGAGEDTYIPSSPTWLRVYHLVMCSSWGFAGMTLFLLRYLRATSSLTMRASLVFGTKRIF